MKLFYFALALALAMFTAIPTALAVQRDSGGFFIDAKAGRTAWTTDSDLYSSHAQTS